MAAPTSSAISVKSLDSKEPSTHGTKQSSVNGRSMSAPPLISDFNLFGYRQGIIDLDTEIANRALDFGVAEKQLDRP